MKKIKFFLIFPPRLRHYCATIILLDKSTRLCYYAAKIVPFRKGFAKAATDKKPG